MFQSLQTIFERPTPFSHYTTETLWADPHISAHMLQYHLNPEVGLSSRRGDFIAASTAWFGERFKLSSGKAVLDLGCGPGLYALPFAKQGAKVTGIDFSPRSIEYAKTKSLESGVSISYRLESYLESSLKGRFDLITMIMCDICALSPEQRAGIFKKVKEWLSPEGRFVFDVYTLGAFSKREEATNLSLDMMNEFWAPSPCFGFQNTFKYEEDKVVLDKYTLIEAHRTREVYNWLQYFDVESLSYELSECGLKVEEVLGDVSGGAHRVEGDEMALIVQTR